MADDIVIRAEGLGKKYVIGHQSAERVPTLRDAISRTAANFARTSRDLLRGNPLIAGDEVEEFWALRDINFEIGRGEVVGVIGHNGAGKSTLLKILSRITEPSEGRLEIRGRVASLLEVGTGFHPELSGRENIFLNSAILGMSRAEIRRKFDEIVAFAETEKFLDTPVKRYSSGMYVRLAFAVAAHIEPEILIIDEVLAVGDADFQQKCLGKMHDVAAEGRTVLFVSHNMPAVLGLCSRAMLLSEGKLAYTGSASSVVDRYYSGTQQRDASLDLSSNARVGSLGNDVRIASIQIPPMVAHNAQLRVQAVIEARVPRSGLVFGVGFNARSGQRVLSSDSDYSGAGPFDARDTLTIQLTIPNLPLAPSDYLVDVGCRTVGGDMIDEVQGFATMRVLPSEDSVIAHAIDYPTSLIRGEWQKVTDD